ncbi:MAG: hypothetical protein IKU24_05635, partial [Clostridia bacterium]|nr:hypothetical protein [Clostridia bacterium]
MKRFLSLLLCALVLCSALSFSAYGVKVNYCNQFNSFFGNMMGFISWYGSNPDVVREGESFPIYTVLDYTFGKINDSYDLDPDPFAVEYPSSVVEAKAKEIFPNTDISSLRQPYSGGGIYSSYITYNKEKDTYFAYFFMGGSSAHYKIYGYTENGNNKYTVYVYYGDRYSENEIPNLGNKPYFYTGDILGDGSREIFQIILTVKSVISYDGTNEKFFSWEPIESIPTLSNMITPDTPLDP